MRLTGKVRSTTAGVCVAVLALAGCGGGDGDDVASPSPSPSPTSASPTPSPAVSPTASPAAETEARAVYYLRDTERGPKLYREFHARPVTGDAVRDAVEAMLTEPPKDSDYTSLWPAGSSVRSVQVSGDTATVDLSQQAAQGNAGAEFESVSIQQLVHTVTAANTSVQQVQVTIEGQARETLWGHVDTRRPIRRAPAVDVLAAVWVLTPEEGGSVARGGEVGGVATVFEATVSWQWVQGGGVVAEGFSTATEGGPGRGDWTAPVEVPPGDYVFRAFESSARDGSEQSVDTKNVTVTG
jgi:hypothetical protein